MRRPIVTPAEQLKRAQRLAIVMLSAIGDAVHVLPVVNALKRHRPELEITWIIQPVPHLLVAGHPAVDRFILFERRSGAGLAAELWRTVRRLRQERFDLVLGLQVYLKAGLLLAATRAPVKLGFDRARARDMQWLFSTDRIPLHEPQHVQDQYFEFLTCLGVSHDPVEWKLDLSDAEREAQQTFLQSVDRPLCAVVAGTSKPEKNWPVERYAELLNVIEGDFGLQPVLVGGPSAYERERAAAIVRLTRAHPRNELCSDLRRLVYLVAGSALVVSPDTGPLHIARALDVPVVGLYGYTNPKRTGPYRKYTDLVVDGYARHAGEAYSLNAEYRPRGMSRVTVDAVIEKIELARQHYLSG
jgi:heptosyltransferase I